MLPIKKSNALRVVMMLALVLPAIARAEEREKAPKPRTFTGELAKLEAGSLSVIRKEEGGSERIQAFTIGDGTKVVVETDEDEVTRGEGGRERRRPKTRDGAAADLKAGQRVTVTATADDKATRVLVLRASAPRAGGEKESRGEPKSPAPGGASDRQKEGEGFKETKEPAPSKEGRESTDGTPSDKTTEREGKPTASRDGGTDKGDGRSSPASGASGPSTRPAAVGIRLPPAHLVRSAASGAWSAPATWEGGMLPSAGAKVLIRTGHTVTYDVSSGRVLRSVHVSGTLTFAPDKDTRLEAGLVKAQPGDGTDEEGFSCHAAGTGVVAGAARPALLVGTPDRPIDAGRTALIRLHYVDGMDADSCPAVVACGGRMELHGQPMNRTWVKLGAKARAGADTLALAEAVTGWRTGDRVIVTGTKSFNPNDHAHERATFRAGAEARGQTQYRGFTAERSVRAIDGARLTLDAPLAFEHLGDGDRRAEVANLSRNVIVESANADADAGRTRGHTMYHRGASGSVSYAEFRHLGKEGLLGRYALHFHLAGDAMRGGYVRGASVWDSHNRWLTIHGTDYLVVRDCVGYQSVGHGFFLEDGSEVYNVLDRNLAVQAYRGKPLPDQALSFDRNDGAGFWWANSRNTFTRNVAVECDQYGYRFEATPARGTDLTRLVRQPDGAAAPVDVRTLPFVRFEDNESHSQPTYGLNLGEGTGGIVAPAADAPFVVRGYRAWANRRAYRPGVPHVLIDGAQFEANTYHIYLAEYAAHDYRDVVQVGRARRMPGEDKPGDGASPFRGRDVEVARLTPVDRLPPATVITHVSRRADGAVRVHGTTSDDGAVARVTVNGLEATPVAANFAEWEVTVPTSAGAVHVTLTAHAEDAAGNVERTPHTAILTNR